MNFEAIPLENRDMVYAVIETPLGLDIESMSARCHELEAIAKGINEITSVWSLAGYHIWTEGRDSKRGDLSHSFEEPVRPQADLAPDHREARGKMPDDECPTRVFRAARGCGFRRGRGFLRTRPGQDELENDERPGRVTGTSMDDLLNRKNPASLFNFLASNYPQYELVINNDVAMQQGVSIANAMENLTTVVGGDVQAERKFRSLAEDLSHLFVENDRGEMVPYSSFMQLKKQGLIEIAR